MTKSDNTTRPVNFIRFHGLTLLVVENGGVEFTEAKPLTDLCGMDWKSAKRTLQNEDNAVLYGVKLLQLPQIGGSRGTSTPQKDNPLSENPVVVYLRLDRARIFLARVNTSHMKAKGNVAAAEELLALQIEWADALNAYETNGVAVKKGQKDTQAELATLYKLRVLAETPAERLALSALIAESFAALGHPLDADSQQSLPLGQ